MTAFKKSLICLGLAAVIASPLAACTNTWHGMKSDYHHMTNTPNSDDKDVPATVQSSTSRTTTTTTEMPYSTAPDAPAPAPAATVQSTTTTTKEVHSSYNYNN